ncbi:sugar phosphate isomerase/epimerase family protein [Algisphaera agarilytica]|uniref:sugar phosphate isomerase/epimerase family protein n=1 Tax=Algisphaera agarilytica TaxID=1385975 RepID=UPI001C8848BC|nr:TIM barrel protein [Algisphaera agarilytica]
MAILLCTACSAVSEDTAVSEPPPVGSQDTPAAEPQPSDATPEATTYGPKDFEAHGWTIVCQAVTFNDHTFTSAPDQLEKLGIKEVMAYRGQIVGGGFDEKFEFTTMSQEARDYVKQLTAEKGITIRHYGVVNAKTPEDWRKLFEFAQELGIQAIVSEPEYDELEMVDALAQEFDIRVGIHNHPLPTKYWHPDIVIHHIKDLSDHMGISGDTGNWARSGLDPLECIKKLEPLDGRIVEIQIKDMTHGYNVPLGTGQSDVAAMLRELKSQNYQGPFVIEYFTKRDTKLNEIRESLDHLYRVAAWIE